MHGSAVTVDLLNCRTVHCVRVKLLNTVLSGCIENLIITASKDKAEAAQVAESHSKDSQVTKLSIQRSDSSLKQQNSLPLFKLSSLAFTPSKSVE